MDTTIPDLPPPPGPLTSEERDTIKRKARALRALDRRLAWIAKVEQGLKDRALPYRASKDPASRRTGARFVGQHWPTADQIPQDLRA